MAPPRGPKRSKEEIEFIVKLGYNFISEDIARQFNEAFKSTTPISARQVEYLRRRYSRSENTTNSLGTGATVAGDKADETQGDEDMLSPATVSCKPRRTNPKPRGTNTNDG
jgi:hypothetical protein